MHSTTNNASAVLEPAPAGAAHNSVAPRAGFGVWLRTPIRWADIKAFFAPPAHAGEEDHFVTDREQVDQSLKKLLGNYMQVVDASRLVPVFSLRGFPSAFGAYFRWWPVTFLVVPLVLVINAVLWTVCRLRGAVFTRWGWRPVEIALAPFVAIFHADFSGFRFLTLRSLVRLFIYARLSGRLSALGQRLQEAKVRNYPQTDTLKEDAEWYDVRIALLKDLKGTLRDKLGMSAIRSLTGVVGAFAVAKEAYAHIPEEWVKQAATTFESDASKDTNSFASVFHFIVDAVNQVLAKMHKADGDSTNMLATILLVILIYALWAVVTNFVVARTLFAEADTYQVEKTELRKLGLPCRGDPSLDISAFVVLVLLLTVPIAWDFKFFGLFEVDVSFFFYTLFIPIPIWLAPEYWVPVFLWLFIRRARGD